MLSYIAQSYDTVYPNLTATVETLSGSGTSAESVMLDNKILALESLSMTRDLLDPYYHILQ